jgi:NADH-quinone oxidoreductase subunit E
MADLEAALSVALQGAKGPGALVPVLQRLQGELGYLPGPALEEVARRLGIPPARVFGVATFYSQFSLKPKGKHLVRVCLGTACHVRGAPQILAELSRQLEVGEDGLSRDGLVSLEEVRCVGACALGPVVVVDGEYWGRMTPANVTQLVRALRERGKGEA